MPTRPARATGEARPRRNGAMIGETIGQYRIEEKLGEGGVGEVFRAIDVMLERTVAIKRLRPELASREQIVERFRTEAQTLAQLDHRNIATLYSFERQGIELLMVMEYVDGETFAGLLRRRGPLPLDEALPLFFQALDGIACAHDQGIVHRDIKGSNLMIRRDGAVKVMDFGIARVLGAERVTLIGQLVGTPEFMAPEQIRGEETDTRADIYSLGVLLYALLCGRVPFAAQSSYDLMKAQVEKPPPKLSGCAPGLPEDLDRVLEKALAKHPVDRFFGTRELKAALEPFAASAAAHSPGEPSEQGRPMPRRGRLELATPTVAEGDTGEGEAASELEPMIDVEAETRERVVRACVSQDAPTRELPSPTRLPRVAVSRQDPSTPPGRRGKPRPLAWTLATVLLVGLNLLWVHRALEGGPVEPPAPQPAAAIAPPATAATEHEAASLPPPENDSAAAPSDQSAESAASAASAESAESEPETRAASRPWADTPDSQKALDSRTRQDDEGEASALAERSARQAPPPRPAAPRRQPETTPDPGGRNEWHQREAETGWDIRRD